MKSRNDTIKENILVVIFFIILLYFLYEFSQYYFNYISVQGIVVGKCIKNARIGVEVKYVVDSQEYTICDRKYRDFLKKGDKVYLRVNQSKYSKAWVDIDKTQSK